LVKITVLKISFSAPCGKALWLSHNVLGTYSFNLLQASLLALPVADEMYQAKLVPTEYFQLFFYLSIYLF